VVTGPTGPTGLVGATGAAATGPTGPTGSGSAGGVAFYQNYTGGNFYSGQPAPQYTAGVAGGTGQIYFSSVWIGKAITISEIAYRITTSGITGAYYNVGLYADDHGTPGALLASGVGDNTFTATTKSTPFQTPYSVVTPGWYWLAYQYPDSTQKLDCLNQSTTVGQWHNFANGVGATGNMQVQGASQTLGMKTNTASTVQTVANTPTLPNPANAAGSVAENATLAVPLMQYKVLSVP